MEPCIFNNSNPVVVSNDIHDIINHKSQIKGMLPRILIDENLKINNIEIFMPQVPTYVLSTKNLQEVVQNIKLSSWWYIESRFIIVEILKNCDDAWNALQIMWKMNLLSSLFVCRATDQSIALYTYNPYANYAPHSWQPVNATFNEQGQQWTLMKRLDSTGKCTSIIPYRNKQYHRFFA